MNKLINEMKNMVSKPSLTLENFISPESVGSNYYDDEAEEYSYSEGDVPSQDNETPTKSSYSDIMTELTQIRKIAMNVLIRLAEHPESESYDMMKKIWTMVDKATLDSFNKNNEIPK